jgi:hypothetical protein
MITIDGRPLAGVPLAADSAWRAPSGSHRVARSEAQCMLAFPIASPK